MVQERNTQYGVMALEYIEETIEETIHGAHKQKYIIGRCFGLSDSSKQHSKHQISSYDN